MYGEAWADSDATTRIGKLEQAWTDNTQFVDGEHPDGISGTAAMNAVISEVYTAVPGLSFEPDDVVIMGRVGVMRWKGISDDRPVAGTDMFEYDHDGMIARCTTFFEGG
jgi:hypothetical protein